jgi:hypothetical protein
LTNGLSDFWSHFRNRQYFKKIYKVLQLLDSSDTVSIREAKIIVSDRSVKMDPTFIHPKLWFFIDNNNAKQKTKSLVHESIATVKFIENKIEHIIGEALQSMKN